MDLEEIGLRLQNLLTFVDSKVNIILREAGHYMTELWLHGRLQMFLWENLASPFPFVD